MITLKARPKTGSFAKQRVGNRHAAFIFQTAVQVEVPRHADHVLEHLCRIHIAMFVQIAGKVRSTTGPLERARSW